MIKKGINRTSSYVLFPNGTFLEIKLDDALMISKEKLFIYIRRVYGKEIAKKCEFINFFN